MSQTQNTERYRSRDFSDEDRGFMARAIELARKGQFSTTPNPNVGCVLVKNGKTIAEGWHERPGGPHAEAMALHNAGEQAQGCTAYITLEPCSFKGRTPACSTSLVEAGITSVVCAMQDPHVKVAGSGFAELNRAGIGIKLGLFEDEAAQLNPGYIKREQTGMPRVTVKMAMSLDGRTAMASGESKWITSSEARADVQRLRAQSCAIITGIGTVLQDNPTLNVRGELISVAYAEPLQLMAGRQPLRVIVDSQAKTTSDLNIIQAKGEVIVFADKASCKTSALNDQESVEMLEMADGLEGMLRELGRRNINEALVEAGSSLAGAFMQQGLVDHLVIYMAPKLMGSSARPLFDLALESMSDNIALDILSVCSIGSDLRIEAAPIRG